MTHKALFGIALLLSLAGCAGIGSSSEDLRGGRNSPCATVRCMSGYHCVPQGRRAACVPDEPSTGNDGGTTSACATVLCAPNKVCVETPSGPECQCSSIGLCVQGSTWDDATCLCVPTNAECTSDSDCRKEDNYCGGCHCLALATGESAPTCRDPVQCFAAPCAVTQGEPACVDGQCVLSSSF